jgi:hypothetical protein
VLSRTRRTAGELAAITRDGHQLSVLRHGLKPPVIDTSEGPVIPDEHGNTGAAASWLHNHPDVRPAGVRLCARTRSRARKLPERARSGYVGGSDG